MKAALKLYEAWKRAAGEKEAEDDTLSILARGPREAMELAEAAAGPDYEIVMLRHQADEVHMPAAV